MHLFRARKNPLLAFFKLLFIKGGFCQTDALVFRKSLYALTIGCRIIKKVEYKHNFFHLPQSQSLVLSPFALIHASFSKAVPSLLTSWIMHILCAHTVHILGWMSYSKLAPLSLPHLPIHLNLLYSSPFSAALPPVFFSLM